MDHKLRTGAGLSGIVLGAGALAFGAFLSNRHRKRGQDSSPNYTKRQPEGGHAQVGRSVTIRKSRSELFTYWREFQNLPGFMENVEAIDEPGGDGVFTWKIKAPAGRHVDVRTEISSEKQGEYIAWRSVEGSDIATCGEVRFKDAPGERGTRVSLVMSYDPPAGALGRAVAKIFLREPQVQARHDLKRLKMLMETGEIATSVRTRGETRAAKQETE